MPLQFERAHNLAKFSERCPRLQMKTKTRDLHGDGRCARPRTTTKNCKSGANQRNRVNAGMPRKILVFIAKRRVDQFRRDLRHRSPNSKLLIESQRAAKQLAVEVANAL